MEPKALQDNKGSTIEVVLLTFAQFVEYRCAAQHIQFMSTAGRAGSELEVILSTVACYFVVYMVTDTRSQLLSVKEQSYKFLKIHCAKTM